MKPIGHRVRPGSIPAPPVAPLASWVWPWVLASLWLVAGEAAALRLDVKVSGVTGAQQTNVLALLSIYQERQDQGLGEARMRALYRLAQGQIRTALEPFGLYRVQIRESLTAPSAPGGAWIAEFRIDPGAPVRITAVNYRVTGPGAENPAFPSEFPMKVGEVLLHSRYEQVKSDLRFAASSHGYLDYRLLRHEVQVDPAANTAVVNFELDTGPLFFFGSVSFTQDQFADSLLQRFVRFKPGDVYDPDKLIGLQARLLGAPYFSRVEIIPHMDQAGERREVPIEVITTLNRPNRFRIGAGFATDIGPRLSMDWKRRYLTRWGDHFQTFLSLSPALSRFNFDYRLPLQNPLADYFRFNADATYYDTSSRHGSVASIHFGRSTVTAGGWRQDLGIDYSYEDYSINDVEQDAVNELVPNVSWSRTVADDPIYTTRGYRTKVAILGTVGGFISPHSYLTGVLDWKWIGRFARDWRFITRANLGATWAASLNDLPASRRFYAGGDNSIRGWGYDASGPDDPLTGETIGGRFLAVGSLEVERVIYGNWSAAVFTDFGNAFDPDYPPQEVNQSVGVGLHYRTPIGQVRLDLAFALTKDNDTNLWGLPPSRLHFIIGPDL